jgi:peptide-N4-(N-acetyl-beta-glucosaminyl)asparagine amidase
VTVPIDTQTSFKDAFNRIKDILHLNEPMENYIIVNSPSVKTFSTSKIYMNLLSKDTTFYICKKNDSEFVDELCKNMMPSLVNEAFCLPVNAPLFLSKMNLMHKMILQALDESASFEIINSIPFDQFGDASNVALIEAACKWFRESFFQYVEKPKCHICGKETTKEEDSRPTYGEAADGAYTVWRYKCADCDAITRFPRYLSTTKLIQTHSGQSIEACILMACVLNSLGFPPRIVCNMHYDRMWVEVFVDNLQTFVHVDPVEGVVDAPYIYEKWGRKIYWIIAVGQHDCTDVTARYTQTPDENIEARGEIFPEDTFQQLIGLRNSTWKFNADADLVEQENERQNNDVIFAEARELKEAEKKEQTVGSE